MASKRILVDTSIIISFLRSKDKSRTIFWKLINDFECCVSSVTFFELYAGALSKEKMDDLELLFNFLEVIDFGQNSAKIAAEIYRELKRENRLIDHRDLFIAATAKKMNLPIATKNKKHFERVKEIKFIN